MPCRCLSKHFRRQYGTVEGETEYGKEGSIHKPAWRHHIGALSQEGIEID
jgi:hypothetical protein